MLWNWTVLDACFLTESWQTRTRAQFAGTVIGVFLMVVAIQGVHKVGREYDRRLVDVRLARAALLKARSEQLGDSPKLDIEANQACEVQPNTLAKSSSSTLAAPIAVKVVPTWSEQTLRGLIHGVAFTGSFLTMLLGMYFNGFILFAIFLGAIVGHVLFARDTVCTGSGVAMGGYCC